MPAPVVLKAPSPICIRRRKISAAPSSVKGGVAVLQNDTRHRTPGTTCRTTTHRVTPRRTLAGNSPGTGGRMRCCRRGFCRNHRASACDAPSTGSWWRGGGASATSAGGTLVAGAAAISTGCRSSRRASTCCSTGTFSARPWAPPPSLLRSTPPTVVTADRCAPSARAIATGLDTDTAGGSTIQRQPFDSTFGLFRMFAVRCAVLYSFRVAQRR